jgi:hypothetical protein
MNPNCHELRLHTLGETRQSENTQSLSRAIDVSHRKHVVYVSTPNLRAWVLHRDGAGPGRKSVMEPGRFPTLVRGGLHTDERAGGNAATRHVGRGGLSPITFKLPSTSRAVRSSRTIG